MRWYRQSISQQQAKPFHCPTQLHPLNSDGCFQIHLLPKLWLIAQGSQKAVKTLLLAKPGGIFLPLVELITYLEAFGSTHTHTHTPNFPDRLLWLKDSLCAHRVDQVVLYNRYLQKISLRAINPYKFSPLHLASKQHFEDSLLY